MKKWVFIWAAVCLTALTACHIETSGNGRLDGYWQLRQVDSLGNGVTVDYAERDVYWSFQHKLLQLSDLHGTNIICRLTEDNQVLTLDTPCLFDRSEGDTPVSDAAVLQPFGVNALQEQLRIVTLEPDRLVLESSVLRLRFRKY